MSDLDDEYRLPPAHNSLSLVPLDDLIEEIKGRADCVVVLVHQWSDEKHGFGTHSGSYFTAIGLLESYKNDLIHLDLENATEG